MRIEMKKFRDENGRLTRSLKEIELATEQEGRAYYTCGNTYLYATDGREYVHCGDDGVLIKFRTSDGYTLFVPLELCGTFLPDVASNDMELIKLKE